MGSLVLVSQPVLIIVVSLVLGAATPVAVNAQCQQTGWTQPVTGWDLAVGTGLKLSGPDGPVFVPWAPCTSGIQATALINGPRPHRYRSGGCYYVVEMPYRNAGMKPTPTLKLHVRASASTNYGGSGSYSAWGLDQYPALSLAPGQTALIRGTLTVEAGEMELAGSVDDTDTDINFHPPDPRTSNNVAHARITVPQGCQ
jgi:hypothetical protein